MPPGALPLDRRRTAVEGSRAAGKLMTG